MAERENVFIPLSIKGSHQPSPLGISDFNGIVFVAPLSVGDWLGLWFDWNVFSIDRKRSIFNC